MRPIIIPPRNPRPLADLLTGDHLVSLGMSIFLEALWLCTVPVRGREVWMLVVSFRDEGVKHNQGRLDDVRALVREAERQGWIIGMTVPKRTCFGFQRDVDVLDMRWLANKNNMAYEAWVNRATASYGMAPIRLNEEGLPSAAEVGPHINEGSGDWTGGGFAIQIRSGED